MVTAAPVAASGVPSSEVSLAPGLALALKVPSALCLPVERSLALSGSRRNNGVPVPCAELHGVKK